MPDSVDMKTKETKKTRFKKWPLIFLIIPLLMIAGYVRQAQDLKKPYDGIYYLTVKNKATKTVTLDKNSWIEISGNQAHLVEDGDEKTYPYDPQKRQFQKDSRTYFCLVNDGYLTVLEEREATKLIGYVSPTSSLYPGFEQGKMTYRD